MGQDTEKEETKMFDFEEMMQRTSEIEKKAFEAEKIVMKINELLDGWKVNEAKVILDLVKEGLDRLPVRADELKKFASDEAIRAYEDEKARQEGDGV